MPYSLLTPPKKVPVYWTFLTLFDCTARIPLLSRISPKYLAHKGFITYLEKLDFNSKN